MKITILGCGPSAGVPLIGCKCKTCASENPKNKRRRSSILIEADGMKILVDTSPDLRAQALDNNITKIDALLYTHAHADHTHGIDELRSFNFHSGAGIDVYTNKITFDELKERFAYAFLPHMPEYGWFRPYLIPHEIEAGKKFSIKNLEVLPFEQEHGKVKSLGFRIGNFAYSTDFKALSEESFSALEGIETWVVDCLQYRPMPTHMHLDLVLDFIERVKPRQAILIHMSHEIEYEEILGKLPKNIYPAFDNMVIDC